MHTDLPDFDECDDSGVTLHVLEHEPLPVIRPLSDWLGNLARALGVDQDIPALKCEHSPQRTSTAAVAAL